jgi:hypothetical protein
MPALDAIAASMVVASEATTAAATPGFHTGCGWVSVVDGLGAVVVKVCVVVDMSSSIS